MKSYGTLTHTSWECRYHVIFIPKYRKKVLFGQVRKVLGSAFHDLARQKESQIEEGHLCQDHVHMLISIPPKHSVSEVVGFLKGKTAIHIARAMGHRKNFVGQNFWARGYYVSTVGRDEKTIREYIKTQEAQDKKFDEGDLFRKNQ